MIILHGIFFQIADNLENVLHLYPDDTVEELIEGADDYQHQYSHGVCGDPYQHQYYANQ